MELEAGAIGPVGGALLSTGVGDTDHAMPRLVVVELGQCSREDAGGDHPPLSEQVLLALLAGGRDDQFPVLLVGYPRVDLHREGVEVDADVNGRERRVVVVHKCAAFLAGEKPLLRQLPGVAEALLQLGLLRRRRHRHRPRSRRPRSRRRSRRRLPLWKLHRSSGLS